MLAAAGIECGPASRALVTARHVLCDAHLISACPAKHRAFDPLRLRPDLDWMVRQSLVAILAGVVDTATLHLDGDDIQSGFVVSAACLRIETDSENFVSG